MSDAQIGTAAKGILKRAIESAGYKIKHIATERLPSNGKFILYENEARDRFILYEEDSTKADLFTSITEELDEKIMSLYIQSLKQEKRNDTK